MPKKLTQEEFITRSNIVHNFKYDYSNVEYVGYEKKVTIICVEHGEFKQTPHGHLSGQGCPKCYNKQTSERQLLTTEEFVKRANKVHNNKYDYSKTVYKNAYEKVIIICKDHGKFIQVAHDHLRDNGCQKCNLSKGENKILNFLIDSNLNFIQQKSFNDCKHKKRLRFDFYLPDLNLCIEYDGEQHFRPAFPKNNKEKAKLIFILTKQRDQIKNQYCKDNNIKLLRIPYWKLPNIEIIINKELKYYDSTCV